MRYETHFLTNLTQCGDFAVLHRFQHAVEESRVDGMVKLSAYGNLILVLLPGVVYGTWAKTGISLVGNFHPRSVWLSQSNKRVMIAPLDPQRSHFPLTY